MERLSDNRHVQAQEGTNRDRQVPDDYYEDVIENRQFYKREMGGDLPPFYVQKAKDSKSDVVVSERFIGIASEGDHVRSRDDIAQTIDGRTAREAYHDLQDDWAKNKLYGAAIAMADDGTAFRSVEDSQYRVVVLDADNTYTLGAGGNPAGVYRPKGDEIIAIVDDDMAERLHQNKGFNGLRAIEDDLMESDKPYATVTITKEIAETMASRRGHDSHRDEGAAAAALAPDKELDGREDTRRGRFRNRAKNFGARGAAIAGTTAFFLRNKFEQPKRRERESDDEYEKRRERRVAMAAVLGGVGILAAIGLTRWAHENDGIINGLGLNDVSFGYPPELERFDPDFDPPALDLPEDIDIDPDFSLPNIDLDPDPEVGVPFIDPDLVSDPDVSSPELPDIDAPEQPDVPVPDFDTPPPSMEYTPEARSIEAGEGWQDTFQNMGIDNANVREALLSDPELMQELQARNIAYYDAALQEQWGSPWGIRMTPDQTMPHWALDLISDKQQEIVSALSLVDGVKENQDVAAAVESLRGTPADIIQPGEGWIQTFNETLREFGIDNPNQQWAMLNNSTLMHELQDMGLAYYDETLLERWGSPWGLYMTESGTLPYETKAVLVQFASPDAYALAS